MMIHIGPSAAKVHTKEPDPSEINVASCVELLQYSRAAPQPTSSLIPPFLPQLKLPSGGAVLYHELDGELFFFCLSPYLKVNKAFLSYEICTSPQLHE